MKKILTIALCAMYCFMANAQKLMIIEKSDKTITSVPLEDVVRVYFEETTFEFENDYETILVGSQLQLNLINNSNLEVSWNSSNPFVASVDKTGLVKTYKKGTTIITAKASNGLECQCEVTVNDITDFISAYCMGGSIMAINNLIKYGSSLSWRFSNNSTEAVTLKSLQLIDGETGQEGNIMSVDVEVEGGNSVAYSTTIGLAGIHAPVTCSFRYEYNSNEYIVDAVYENKSLW